jgi:hypothetical protein
MSSRILVLVIASDLPAHYVEMQNVWRESVKRQMKMFRVTDENRFHNAHRFQVTNGIDNAHRFQVTNGIDNAHRFRVTNGIDNAHRFDTWFIKAKPERLWIGDIANDGPLSDIIEFDNDAMTIYVKGEETYIPGILHKTIEAIRALGRSFDYIWRTNLSSVLDYQGLLDYVDSCDISYGGYVGTSVDGYKFASGAGFLMSRCAVDYLIENESLLMMDVIDDVAIGKLLEPRFKLIHIERCWVDDGSCVDGHYVFGESVFHFRCETYKHERTVQFMNAALRHICEMRSK